MCVGMYVSIISSSKKKETVGVVRTGFMELVGPTEL